MTERKLASIRRVKELLPIEGADRIVLAKIDGWNLVTQKDNYQPGDLCVYFEIDSFLPVEERFEFLRKGCFKSTKELGDGFRIKTIKLKGQVSQGLSLPLHDFPELKDLPEGTDVTGVLRVQRYEKPLSPQLSGVAKGNFPSFIRKTDQERAQNLVNEILEHQAETFEISLKLDGSSCTVYKNQDGIIGVCSRNLDLLETEDNTFWKTARSSGIYQLVSDFNKPVAIQGELMGPGVQGNREQFPEHNIYVFDIWDIANQRYVPPVERIRFLSQAPTIKQVPILFHQARLVNFLHTGDVIQDLLNIAKGPSINHAIREGVVFKSCESNFTFKTINNEFLLKEKD